MDRTDCNSDGMGYVIWLGNTAPDNLQVLCADCNLAKSADIVQQMTLW